MTTLLSVLAVVVGALMALRWTLAWARFATSAWLSTQTRRADDAAYAASFRATKELALDARLVSVAEREITLKERLHERPSASQAMPDDLAARVRSWEDDFAQEQERDTLMSLYAEYRDWDEVRRKLPALAPFQSADIAAPREGLIQ